MASLLELVQQNKDNPGFYAAYSQANKVSAEDWAKALGVPTTTINKYFADAGISIQNGNTYNPQTAMAKQAMQAGTSGLGFDPVTPEAAASLKQQQQAQPPAAAPAVMAAPPKPVPQQVAPQPPAPVAPPLPQQVAPTPAAAPQQMTAPVIPPPPVIQQPTISAQVAQTPIGQEIIKTGAQVAPPLQMTLPKQAEQAAPTMAAPAPPKIDAFLEYIPLALSVLNQITQDDPPSQTQQATNNQAIGGGVNAVVNAETANRYFNQADKFLERSDPFREQRPGYQGDLRSAVDQQKQYPQIFGNEYNKVAPAMDQWNQGFGTFDNSAGVVADRITGIDKQFRDFGNQFGPDSQFSKTQQGIDKGWTDISEMQKSYGVPMEDYKARQSQSGEVANEMARRQQEFNNYGPILDQAQKSFSDLGQQTQGYMGDYQTALGRTDQVNDEIARSYTQPDYWQQNSVLAGLNRSAVNDTTRALAAQGYNMSGNVPMEVAQRLQDVGGKYVPQFQQNMLGASTAANNAAQGRLGAVQTSQQNQNLSLQDLQQIINSRNSVNQNLGQLSGGLNALTGSANVATGGFNAITGAINAQIGAQGQRINNLGMQNNQANTQLQGIQGRGQLAGTQIQGLNSLLNRQQLGYNNVSGQQANLGQLSNFYGQNNGAVQNLGNFSGAQFNPAAGGQTYGSLLNAGTNAANQAWGGAGVGLNNLINWGTGGGGNSSGASGNDIYNQPNDPNMWEGW